MQTKTPTGAETVTWDLSPLYNGIADPTLDADLNRADELAAELDAEYRGRIASLDAAGLRTLIARYEDAVALNARPMEYAYLAWAADTANSDASRLLARTQERQSRFQQATVFIELELAALPDLEARLAAPELNDRRHLLEVAALRRPYLLTEPEEKVMAEMLNTGANAWVRLFDETHAAARYTVNGQDLNQEEVLDLLYDPEREARIAGWRALTNGLREAKGLNTFIFNQLLSVSASNDRLRGYPTWVTARNVANEVDDDSVQALVDAGSARYDLVRRYYTLKRDLLGVDELFDYDRYAPLPAADARYRWDEARAIVLDSFGRFHPAMQAAAGRIFDERWIDAAPTPSKQAGAFCSEVVHDLQHPYVLMTYQGRISDVQTLAHELGHGLHGYLAAPRGPLMADTPLTTAETASTFAEMLVFTDLLEQQTDPAVRLALLADKIENTFATVFRQVSMNRFEHAIHTLRRESGMELTTEQFNMLWLQSQRDMFGDSVTMTDEYGLWWSYVWHFVGAPGYVYAFAFGELLVMALFARYQQGVEGFADAYLGALAAGGSDWPHALMQPLGVDLTDPGFWQEGLAIIEGMIAQAEELAAQL
ncbi:MAG: M3 family oligoendopeptidase [Anaerolineae bacterium]